MSKSTCFALILISSVGLLVLATAFYPLVNVWQLDPQLVINRVIFAIGVILSLFGLIMILPKKILTFFLAIFSSETALKNQRSFGTPGNLSNFGSNLALLFKLNSYKWSKPIGLVTFISRELFLKSITYKPEWIRNLTYTRFFNLPKWILGQWCSSWLTKKSAETLSGKIM